MKTALNLKEKNMLTIKNKQLTVEINPKGAELTHVIDNHTHFDYIWNGAEWPKHAPILFPAIGRSTEDSYLLDVKTYPMQQHGFASDYDFEVLEQAEDSLTLLFKDNEETAQSYPFHFAFKVIYQLVRNKLNVAFEVQNHSSESLSFALGFHPAFNLPGKFENYFLNLTTEEKALQQFEIVKNPFPYRSGKLLDLAQNASHLPLERSFFEKGLVILNNDIQKVQLASEESGLNLTVELADFPYLCLWTKEDMDLPYLCIEPFQGLPDVVNQKQELLEKEGNVVLAAGEKADYQVSVTFGL